MFSDLSDSTKQKVSIFYCLQIIENNKFDHLILMLHILNQLFPIHCRHFKQYLPLQEIIKKQIILFEFINHNLNTDTNNNEYLKLMNQYFPRNNNLNLEIRQTIINFIETLQNMTDNNNAKQMYLEKQYQTFTNQSKQYLKQFLQMSNNDDTQGSFLQKVNILFFFLSKFAQFRNCLFGCVCVCVFGGKFLKKKKQFLFLFL